MKVCECKPGRYKDGVCQKCGELSQAMYQIRRLRAERQSKWIAVSCADGWIVATGAGKPLATGLTEAHARLFAASGRLLAALEELVWCVRDGQLGDFSPLMDEIFDAEHAIKGALGEKQDD